MIHPITIGSNRTKPNSHPADPTNLPKSVKKLSGALLTTVSAVTEIGSPLFSAVNAEAVAAVSQPATVGTITPPGKTLVTPTTALVAAPVIRLFFRVLHPAVLKQERASQRYT